jgi:hypothetical protein
MTKRIRTLTVSRLYREWGEFHRKGECVVPSIRLNGKWLAALGIVPGQKIRVITNGPIITLAPVNLESELNDKGPIRPCSIYTVISRLMLYVFPLRPVTYTRKISSFFRA